MYDEVFFHSVTKAWLETGKYTLTAAPELYGHEILFYGPVYFWLQAGILKILGIGIWQFRLLNVLGGFSVLMLCYGWLKQQGLKQNLALLVPAILLLDNLFGNILHSGRMDFVALALAMGGVYCIDNGKTKLYLYLGVILVSLALITTPRMIFMLPFFALCLWSKVKKEDWSLLKFAFLGAITFVPWGLWVIVKVGLVEYISMFQHPIITEHIGSKSSWRSFIRYWYHIPLLILWLVSVYRLTVTSFQKKFQDLNFSELGIHLSIILFWLLVQEKAAYSAMLLPLLWLVTFPLLNDKRAISLSQNGNRKSLIFPSMVTVQVLLLLGIFLFKTWATAKTWEERNPLGIALNYPNSNAVVYSEAPYYFHILSDGRDFRFARWHDLHCQGESMGLFNEGPKSMGWQSYLSTLRTGYHPVWRKLNSEGNSVLSEQVNQGVNVN